MMAEAVADVFAHIHWIGADGRTRSTELGIHAFKCIFLLGCLLG
jgi:hypothetical protein